MLRGIGSSNRHLIGLLDVCTTYATDAGEITVLEDLHLQVRPGEFVSVVGPLGLRQIDAGQYDHRMITGIDRLTSGQVIVADEPTGNLDTAIADRVFALCQRLVD